MLHNLRWLQDLNVVYDSSTFDTDPFEPQPDGTNTIFPFLVRRDDFELVRRASVHVAAGFDVVHRAAGDHDRHLEAETGLGGGAGGLALLNVHPDYLGFEAAGRSSEYSPALYREFLNYVTQHYRHRCWHALPGAVARYVRQQSAR